MRQIHRLLSSLLLACISAPSSAEAVPHPIQQNGRHALIVDGAPQLILGAQTNNSSNYPADLPNAVGVMSGRRNGDLVDNGLSLPDPTLLKVRLGTYR